MGKLESISHSDDSTLFAQAPRLYDDRTDVALETSLVEWIHMHTGRRSHPDVN